MTRNQIEYWRLNEQKRSNRANEEHARNVLSYNYKVLAETNRSNLARERETERSNRANEMQRMIEANRNFQLQLRGQAEVERSHLANEKLIKMSNQETQRSNVANERIRELANQAALINAGTQQKQQAETVRSNMARELETNRANLVKEGQNADVLRETRRSNEAREEYNLRNLTEITRANIAHETEENRKNLANESLTRQRNEETGRHNRVQEVSNLLIEGSKQLTGTINNAISNLSRIGLIGG